MPELVRSVSVSTRAPRSGERAGADYRFVTPAIFTRMRARREFLEWARVHQADYGTLARPVRAALARGRDVMLSIDVQGAQQIRRRLGRQAVLIFLLPPSMRALKRRLIRRHTDSREAIARRLEAARREMAHARMYDYIVVNQELATAVEDTAAIVTAERLRAGRHKGESWLRHRLKSS